MIDFTIPVLCGFALVAYILYLANTAWHSREFLFNQQRLQDQQAWLTSQSQTIDYCSQLYQVYVATAHEMVKCALQDPNAQILGLPNPVTPEPVPSMGIPTPPVMHDPTEPETEPCDPDDPDPTIEEDEPDSIDEDELP